MRVLIKILFVTILIIGIEGCAQPNTKTRIEFGIVNPQPDKHYIVFAEVKADTTTSRLMEDMDYLDPDVSDLSIILTNYVVVGDTLFGYYDFTDKSYQQYLKAGLISVNNNNMKYSPMVVTGWVELDIVEQKPGGFFIRKIRK